MITSKSVGGLCSEYFPLGPTDNRGRNLSFYMWDCFLFLASSLHASQPFLCPFKGVTLLSPLANSGKSVTHRKHILSHIWFFFFYTYAVWWTVKHCPLFTQASFLLNKSCPIISSKESALLLWNMNCNKTFDNYKTVAILCRKILKY